MSPKVQSPSPSATAENSVSIPIKDLHPNDWNPNKLNAFQLAKLYESISTHGFNDPLLVRPCPHHPDFQIVDGEHRFGVASDLGYTELPCIVRQMVDPVARKMTLIANELHGQADPAKVGELLRGVLEDTSVETLLVGLPFDEDVLKGFLGFDPNPPTPSAAPMPATPAGSSSRPESGAAQERWVERTYRIPESIAKLLDEALVKAQTAILAESGRDATVGEALEVIAAEYMGS